MALFDDSFSLLTASCSFLIALNFFDGTWESGTHHIADRILPLRRRRIRSTVCIRTKLRGQSSIVVWLTVAGVGWIPLGDLMASGDTVQEIESGDGATLPTEGVVFSDIFLAGCLQHLLHAIGVVGRHILRTAPLVEAVEVIDDMLDHGACEPILETAGTPGNNAIVTQARTTAVACIWWQLPARRRQASCCWCLLPR
jgi:hypothetical protein